MKFLLLLAVILLVGVVDRQSLLPLEAAVRDADRRKEVRPETLDEIAYWRRHERNSAECRGQTWISQCCTDAREDLTCLKPEDIR